MREIKYRVKTKTDNKWIYGQPRYDYLEQNWLMCTDDSIGYKDILKDTFSEYTDVKDKNDKEVYEGDIIFLEEEHLYGKVCWESLRWYVYWYGWIDKEGIGTVYDIVNENPLSDELLTSEEKIWLPVVGNIYDNPELLKGENLYD